MTRRRIVVELLRSLKDGSKSTNGSGTIEEVNFRRGQSVAKNDSIRNPDDIVSEARLFQDQRTQSLNDEAIASSLGSVEQDLRQIPVHHTTEIQDRLTIVLLKTMLLYSKTV